MMYNWRSSKCGFKYGLCSVFHLCEENELQQPWYTTKDELLCKPSFQQIVDGNRLIFRERTRLDGTIIVVHSTLQFGVRAKFRSDRKILKYISCALWHRMMTSSNGNIFTLLGFVRGIQRWQTGFQRWPVTSNAELWCFFGVRLKNGWANSRDAVDLRYHCINYDVTVMVCDVTRSLMCGIVSKHENIPELSKHETWKHACTAKPLVVEIPWFLGSDVNILSLNR